MKTRNQWIFMLAACLCGALFCTQVNAKVCFVGDPDCAQGAEFEEYTPPETNTLCEQEGYNEKPSDCLASGRNIGAVCPYDASYVKCCGPEFAYQTCVFPLENVSNNGVIAKCGNLYKCQCAEEYKTPAQWAKEASSACQPGGGVCILSTDTTVRYNKCICDVNYFPYEGTSCPNDMILVESCKDSDGNSRVSCQCPSGYRTCTFGGAPGAKSCKQGGLILYNSCKSAEDECENAGYFKDCHTQTCYHDTNSTEKVKKTYPISCEDSYEACPHAYGYYKCRWSAENYCAQWDMTEYSKQLPSTCIKDGVQGTVVPCNLGGSYNGGGSTKNYLGYYRCKLTCEQQAQAGASSYGDLMLDTGLANAGIKAYYNIVGSEKHLYVAEGGVVPTANYERWKDIGSKIDYASINGIYALCDREGERGRYSSCCEEREKSSNYYNRPILQFDGVYINASNYFLSKNMSDIGVEFYASKTGRDNGGWSETFVVDNNYTWNNVTLKSHLAPDNAQIKDVEKYKRIDNKNEILVKGDKTLTFTGDTYLDSSLWTWHTTNDSNSALHKDHYETNKSADFLITHVRAESKAKVRFNNATIYGNGMSWDGDSATMLFYNTKMGSSWDSLGHVWSLWNIGLNRSKINVSLFRPRACVGNKYSFPYSIDQEASTGNGRELARYRCVGTYLYNSSTLNITDYYAWIENRYAKIYVDGSSTLNSEKPIQLNGSNSDMICLAWGAKAKINNRSFDATSSNRMLFGWNKEGTYVGSYPAATNSTIAQEWYNRFKNCNSDGKNCKWPSNPVCTSSGWFTDDGDGHDVAFYPKKVDGYLCTACNSCSAYGMGFN